jgi:hypothetical protein
VSGAIEDKKGGQKNVVEALKRGKSEVAKEQVVCKSKVVKGRGYKVVVAGL